MATSATPAMSHLRKQPSARRGGAAPSRDSNMVRASVFDVAMQLGFGDPNSTVASWMFNNPVEEEEEEGVSLFSWFCTPMANETEHGSLQRRSWRHLRVRTPTLLPLRIHIQIIMRLHTRQRSPALVLARTAIISLSRLIHPRLRLPTCPSPFRKPNLPKISRGASSEGRIVMAMR